MDIPGYDAWKLMTPEEDAAWFGGRRVRNRRPEVETTFGLVRYVEERDTSFEVRVRVSAHIDADGYAEEVVFHQPVGPQLEPTAAEEAEAAEALREEWETGGDDYDDEGDDR